MNLKTTFVLLLIAGGCGVLFWKGPELSPRLGLTPKPVATTDAGTFKTLADLPKSRITRVEIQAPHHPKLVLEGPDADKLELPGNWPIRRYEVAELLHALGDLKSRYHPIAINDKTDLHPYGLASGQKPIAVEVTTSTGKLKLHFGQAPLEPDQNPFTRAAYVRLEGKDEVIRLGPQVLPVLLRDEETYRRRQLFPEWERAVVAEPKRPPRFPDAVEEPERPPTPTFLLNNNAAKIAVTTPAGKFTLQRVAPNPKPQAQAGKPDADVAIQPAKLAESWVIAEPVRDRIDPDKARAILTAIPNLWLEKFVDTPPGAESFFGLGEHPDVTPQLLTLLGGSIPAGTPDTIWRATLNYAALGEAKSYAGSLKVEFETGEPRMLQIGRISRTTIGGDDLRFAKLDRNPLIFELKGDKLNDLQISLTKPSATAPTSPVDELRDASLARFDEKQITGIDIVSGSAGKERRIKLEKTGDEWKLAEPVADAADRAEVTELLAYLKGMEARKGSIIDGPLGLPLLVTGSIGSIDPKELLGLVPDQAKKLTLTFDPKTTFLVPKTDSKTHKTGWVRDNKLAYSIGVRDAGANKRAVMLDGWNRINIVADQAGPNQVSRLDRQPSGYRSLKLFDGVSNKIGEIIVERVAIAGRPGDSFMVQQQAGTPAKWSIVAPFKAEADTRAANQLAAELGGLSNQKYIYDPKTDEPFKITYWPSFLTVWGIPAPTGDGIFGLEHPALTVALKFSEPKGAPDVVVEIGNARSPTEYYARRKGASGIFAVSDKVVKAIDINASDLLDKTLIKLDKKEDIQTIRRTMGGQELEIPQNTNAQWEITKPAPGKADQDSVDKLADMLSNMRAMRIEAVNPPDLKKFGLEPPTATIAVETLERSKLVEKTLLIGNPVDAANPKGDRFVKALDSKLVGVIPGPVAQRLLAEPQRFRDLSLGGFVTADKLVLEKGERKITFVKGAGGWKVKQPVEADAEDEDLRELHDLLAQLRAEEIVEDKPANLAKYGLDTPTHWRVFNGDREVLHLLVGDREKIGPDKKAEGFRAYAMLAKGTTVVLLDPLLSSRLNAEYRKRAVWDPVAPAQINEISVKAPDAADSFTLLKVPAGFIDPAKPADRINPELVNDLLHGLASLKAERYVVDKGADLAKYGLDKPRVVTVKAEDGKKRSILIGSLLDGKRLYAKTDDPNRTDVFLLNETDTLSLNRTRSVYTVKPKEEPKKTDLKKDDFKKVEEKKKDLKDEEKK